MGSPRIMPPAQWLVVVAGAALGWWMFHYRGAALFAGVGLAVAMGFTLLARVAPRLAAAAALGGAALALHSSSTLGWAGADAADGSRFKASPVGLSHVLTPARLESETVDCGWHRVSSYADPCTVADASAFGWLRTVYPLVLSSALLALAGSVTALLRSPRSTSMHRALAGSAGAVALVALVLFAQSVRPALAAITGLPVGVGGTLGTMQLSLALLLCLTAAIGSHSRSANRIPGFRRFHHEGKKVAKVPRYSS